MKEGSMELPIGDIFQNTDKDKLSIGVKLSDKPKNINSFKLTFH